MKILFTGGGTGGHFYPLVAVIREIRKMYPKKDLEFYYIGPKDEFGSILLSQEDVEIKTILSGKIRRYFSLKNISDILFNIPIGIIQSLFYIARIEPHLVFSKGGSGAWPIAFAANLFKIPIFIHESDIVPGLSNNMASKWARKIFISFPKTEYFDLDNTTLVGNPIRSEILNGDKEKARDLFDLTFKKPVMLFFGGSQGAEFINDFILRNMNALLEDFEIIHICGVNNFKQVESEAQVIVKKELEQYYHLYSFLDEGKLKHAYRASDFAVSRSGSGSVFELSAVGIPSILVPLPSSANGHQGKNAYFYAETGAAVVIEQDNFTQSFFMEKIRHLFAHPEKISKMKEEALKFSKPYAARTIARDILEFLMLK